MSRTTSWQNIVQYADADTNDSDKTQTVPAATQWVLLSIWVELITTVTVGNRQVDVLITDASDNAICKAVAGAVQAASLTRVYIFAPLNPQETGFTNTVMFRSLPQGLALPAGYKVRVYDSAAIAAAADDMTVRILVDERSE